ILVGQSRQPSLYISEKCLNPGGARPLLHHVEELIAARFERLLAPALCLVLSPPAALRLPFRASNLSLPLLLFDLGFDLGTRREYFTDDCSDFRHLPELGLPPLPLPLASGGIGAKREPPARHVMRSGPLVTPLPATSLRRQRRNYANVL